MTSIDLETVLTTLYVLVDDWYTEKGKALLSGKAGAKPRFSDSELLTLLLAQDFIPYPGETQYVAYVRANHLDLFPKLVDQSQFNRRGRNLQQLVEALRQHWVTQLGGYTCKRLLLDTKPVPVLSYKRRKSHSNFAGRAEYGHCAARKLNYFGFKLVLLSTFDGLPLAYNLVPANMDERLAAESVLYTVNECDILADKGFLSADWQARITHETGNVVITPKRANQITQNPSELDAVLGALRERIEGVFHQLQNTGRNIERLLAKTVFGLTARITLKVTCLILKRLLARDFSFDIQSFSISH
jgi:Transposase DDE domain